MSDLQGAWVTTVFLVVVASVLDVVIQQFALHSALARARVHAPDIAGITILALWAPTIAVWLGAGIGVGFARAHGCNSADSSGLWLGTLYPLTAWPAVAIARRAKVPLPGWYWPAQASVALSILLFGGFPCLL